MSSQLAGLPLYFRHQLAEQCIIFYYNFSSYNLCVFIPSDGTDAQTAD